MLPSFILSLREGLEAALIIGILLGALRQMRGRDPSRDPGKALATAIWLGVGSAVLFSLLTALLLIRFGLELEGRGEAIFEGLTMLLAAGILTWVIFWMSKRTRSLKENLEAGVQQASQAGKWSLFGLAFLAVLREGVELALFLTASAFASNSQQTAIGALIGLGTAILLGWLLFTASIRLNLRRFFQLTGFLLILFAAGLIARGVFELNEVGWIPPVIENVWNISSILDKNSVAGELLGSLFGYNPSPSLTEIIAYATYFVVTILGLAWVRKRSGRSQQASA